MNYRPWIMALLVWGASVSAGTLSNEAEEDFLPGEIIFSWKADTNEASSSLSESKAQTMLSRMVAPDLRVTHVRQLTRARHRTMNAKGGSESVPSIYLARWSDHQIAVPDVCAVLRSDPRIAFAEPNWRRSPAGTANDPYFSSSRSWGQTYADQWGLHTMRVPQAWDSVGSSNPVVLAVLDTGIDSSHPDIVGNLWINEREIPENGVDDDGNGFIDDLNGWNTKADNNDLSDTYGHGTRVAGVACALRNNGIGIAGIANNARLMVVKHADGSGSVADLIEAIEYAVANSADVINISYSGKFPSSAEEAALRHAWEAGIPVFAAAGNNGNDIPLYPAAYPTVIAVGASDHTDHLVSSSSYGYFMDILAPGDSILTLRAAGATAAIPVGTDYEVSSGTSLACPAAAGVAALLLQKDGTLTAEEIRHILRGTSTDVMDPGWDPFSNYGRINAEAAIQRPKPLTPTLDNLHNLGNLSGTNEIRGSTGFADFSHYLLEQGMGLAPTSFVAIACASNVPSSGILGTWDTTAVADGVYTLRLTACQANGYSYEDRAYVRVGNHFLKELQPWPGYTYPDSDASRMTAADIDGDGTNELITVSFRWVFVRRANGASLPGWPVTLPTVGHALGYPAVGDLDGDGYPEIGVFYAPENNAWGQVLFKIWRHDGTDVPGWPIVFDTARDDNSQYTTPVFADMDQDGQLDIIWTSTTNLGSQAVVNVVRLDQTPLPGWPVTLPSGTVTAYVTPAVGDLDGDGRFDIAVMTQDLRVFVLSNAGDTLSGWPVTLGSLANRKGSLAFADFDHDGRLDLFAASYSGDLAIFQGNGAMMPGWPRYMGGGVSPPSLADLDGDGDLEIAVGGGGGWSLARPFSAGAMWVMHHDGTDAAGWPRSYPSTTLYPAAIADMDGDGKLDICAPEYQAKCHAWDRNGNELTHLGFPLAFNFLAAEAPIIEDMTGDGVLDLVTGNGKIAIWPLPATSDLKRNPFPQLFAHAERHCRYTPWKFDAPVDVQLLDASRPSPTFEIQGDHFLAGISASLGTNAATVVLSAVDHAVFLPAPNMSPGRYDIIVNQPGSGTAVVHDAVLLFSSMYADDDGDRLPNDWEFRFGFDPFDGEHGNPDHTMLGDADHDGINNFLEMAYEGMGVSPTRADAQEYPRGRILGDAFTLDYVVNTNRSMVYTPQASTNLLEKWMTCGSTNALHGFVDEALPGNTPPFVNRRVSVPVDSYNHIFLRILVAPE